MSKYNLDKEVNLRLATAEKEKLKQLADEAGVSMSEFVRATTFSAKKLVFLVEGAEIAASLFQIRTDLDALRREDVIPASEIDRLQNAIEGVGTELHAIRERLSDLHDEDEEGNTDG